MKRIRYVLCALALAAVAGAAQLPRPNLIVIMADDPGWSDLGGYGREIETPRLAAATPTYEALHSAKQVDLFAPTVRQFPTA